VSRFLPADVTTDVTTPTIFFTLKLYRSIISHVIII